MQITINAPFNEKIAMRSEQKYENKEEEEGGSQ